MALRVNIIPGTLSTQALVEGPSSKRAVAPLGVVGRGEDLLNPERAQEAGPHGANELPALVVPKYGMTCRTRVSLTVLAV